MRVFTRDDCALLRAIAKEYEERFPGFPHLAEIVELNELADAIEARLDEATGIEASEPPSWAVRLQEAIESGHV